MNTEKLDELQKYADELQKQIDNLRSEATRPTVPWEGALVRYKYIIPAPMTAPGPAPAPVPDSPTVYRGPIDSHRAEIVDSELHPQFMPNDTGENPWPDDQMVEVRLRKGGSTGVRRAGEFQWLLNPVSSGSDVIGSRPAEGWAAWQASQA